MNDPTMEGTTRHVYMTIASAKSSTDAQLEEMFGRPASEIRRDLASMERLGLEVIPSEGCDNRDAKGYCLGHPAKPEPKPEPTSTRDMVALATKAMGHAHAIVYENEIGKPFAKVAKHQYFNPFDVSGDALELACHLSMTIDYVNDGMRDHVITRARANGQHYICTQLYRPETKLAMTMYAITYVAACIGEDMPCTD